MFDHIGNFTRKIEVTPWHIWFAWRPVKTVANEHVWLKRIYRREIVSYVDIDEWMHYEYGNIFDIIKQ
jgi:hypothetical protein